MKIKAIHLNDEELPDTITVEMTRDEALIMARVTGGYSDKTAREAHGDIGYASTGIYDALVGSVFNRYWDDGVQEAFRYKPGGAL